MCLGAVLAFGSVPSHAALVFNASVPISLSVFVSCAVGGAGEVVDLSGPLHVLVTATITGDTISVNNKSNSQGISGTGETTGTKYQAIYINDTKITGSLQNGQFTTTFISQFAIIGAGTGNNFVVHENEHLTLNADGTATVFFDNFFFTCK
jgi:hypothetical protein